MANMITAVNDLLDDLRGGKMTESPVVQVEEGQLQGRLTASPAGKPFYCFQGIPYATPPLGSLRFQAPQPARPWDGIRDATAEGNICSQIDVFLNTGYEGDENCLFLNVYTPNLDGEFLPVMVYIHGGAFRFGSGNSNQYGADFLVEKDVVVVTLNYRCGPLGFLCLNTPEVPGNAGLKDIALALRWIKKNIGSFGGNAGNLTVFGESAGGAAVSLLSVSPLTKNMISKAIMQSGTALDPWAWQKNPLENARILAKEMGCESNEIDDILEFLRSTPVRSIIETTLKLSPILEDFSSNNFQFTPVIEKEFCDVESFITQPFIELVNSGKVAEIPIMIGTTGIEFCFEPKSDDLRVFIPEEFNLDRNSDEALKIADEIKHLYFNNKNVSVENWIDFFKLVSDRFINVGTNRFVKYLRNVSSKPIFVYKFDYCGAFNLANKVLESLGVKHAVHTDELWYLFRNALNDNKEANAQDLKTRERMVRLWTDFAKSGNPTPDENYTINVTWLPVTKDCVYYLKISNELSLETNPDHERMDFWDGLYNKYFKIWEQPKSNGDVIPAKVEETFVGVSDIPTEGASVDKAAEEHKAIVPEESTAETDTNQQNEEETVITQEKEEVIPEKEEEGEEKEEEKEVIEIPSKVELQNEVIIAETTPVTEQETEIQNGDAKTKNGDAKLQNGDAKIANGAQANGDVKKRTSNEIKMVSNGNWDRKDVIRANDPPEDDLPKNIGVNKFVNFFESLGGSKK